MRETSESSSASLVVPDGGTASIRQKLAFSPYGEMQTCSPRIGQSRPRGKASLSFDRQRGRFPTKGGHLGSNPFLRRRMLRQGRNAQPCPNCGNERKTFL